MKLLAGNKVLCALLAAVAAGMGVQTYYLVQLHRRMNAAEEVETAKVTTSEETADRAAGASPALADPFAELEEAEARMRSLFDDFYDRFDTGLDESWFDRRPFFADGDSFLFSPSGQLGPRVDLQDRDDHYEMLVDVPGADEADVVVRAENDMLIVEGSRSSTLEESEPGSYVRRERHTGRFERRVSLPDDADPSSVRTEYEDGVLRVTLRKKGDNG